MTAFRDQELSETKDKQYKTHINTNTQYSQINVFINKSNIRGQLGVT